LCRWSRYQKCTMGFAGSVSYGDAYRLDTVIGSAVYYWFKN
jgi:hypothetical protein